MSIQSIFDEIESVTYTALVGICSGSKCFMDVVRERPEYKNLVENYDEDVIIKRVHELLQRDFDHNYERPWTEAIATYFIVLFDCGSQKVQELIRFVWSQEPSGLWPRWIGGKILEALE
jgi:hypothetical protein